jgi:hypothetical protein
MPAWPRSGGRAGNCYRREGPEGNLVAFVANYDFSLRQSFRGDQDTLRDQFFVIALA